MPHARAAAADQAGPGRGRMRGLGQGREPWRGEADRQAGGRRASGRAGVARFCHLIHIIMEVSLLDGVGELIALVIVSPTPEFLH